MTVKKEKANNDKFKNAICYIPFVSIILFFIEEKKSKELLKNIKYGAFLLLGYIIIRFLITGVLLLPIWGLLFLIYAGVSIFFWYKAYSGEDVTIEYIDKFEEKVKENIK